MGIVRRQSIPSTIAAYAGVALGFINFNYLLPRFATTEQVGLVRMIIAVAVIFSQLGTLGIVYTTLRYFPYFNDREKKHHGFFTFLMIAGTVGFCFFSLLLWLFQDPIKGWYQAKAALFNDYFIYLFPIGGFLLFSEILSGYSRSLFKTIVPTIIREVLVRLCNLVAIVLLIFKLIDFNTFIVLIIGGYLVQVIAMLIYLKWRNQLFWNAPINFLSGTLIRELAGYTGFMFLTIVSGIFISSIDVVMLGALAGLSDTGIYGVVLTIATVIIIPSRAIAQIVVPILAEAWKKNDLVKIREMYRQTAINNLLIGAIIFILIWVNLDNFFSYLPKSYAAGKWVFFVMGLSKLLDLGTGSNGEIILTSKHFRFILFTNIYLIAVALVSYSLLIPRYGMLGAAIATAISILSYNAIRSLFLYFKYRMHPFTFDYLKGLMIVIIVLLISEFLPRVSIIELDIAYKSIFVSVSFLILILSFKPSAEIDGTLKQFWNTAKSKFYP